METGRAAALEKEIRDLQAAEPEPASNKVQRLKVAISAQIALRAPQGAGTRCCGVASCSWDGAVVPVVQLFLALSCNTPESLCKMPRGTLPMTQNELRALEDSGRGLVPAKAGDSIPSRP